MPLLHGSSAFSYVHKFESGSPKGDVEPVVLTLFWAALHVVSPSSNNRFVIVTGCSALRGVGA
eukprot:CAMPEP_0177674434 /NCGR_PEP_ID=MMETSP0447-20121125/26552_1 /TAXON_ID=0 /ORGANISM="Stygamoeba regulata, Strain BSH-02190019" /LENGTH=62 /DNA_ID=CAMNT_0019182527 /DNA_START=47 /DNA_END=231 /DNA_ORIENTATION=-